mgnify:CR=1 FL=1
MINETCTMKKLIKLILFLMIAYPLTGAIFSACSEESDCSMTGRPMVYANMYTINPETKAVLNDTLDSLTVTAFGTDSIIINNQKKVHDIEMQNWLPIFHRDMAAITISAFLYRKTGLFESNVLNCD